MTKRAPLKVPACIGQCNKVGTEGHESCIFIDWSEAIIRTSPCRSGCPTQNHKSYADCCKGIQINTGVLLTSSGKSWEGELQAYRDARSQGIQPTGTTMAKVQEALDISDATGVAYQGDNPYG